jgi:predicted nucleic acid-binding protein
MNSIVVDTNPLVYIYSGIPNLGRLYADLLGNLSAKYTLVIPKIVYGELSLIFRHADQLNHFLSDTGIVIAEIEPETYLLAARRWDNSNKRRVLMCQRCGKKLKKLVCSACNSEIKVRQHVLSDFVIGAYALQLEERKIVTNDKGYYSTYFPELTIISADF